MAQASKSYEVKFTGNTTDLSKSFQKLQREAGVLGKSVQGSSNLMRNALAGVSVVAFTRGLQSAVMAASSLSESIAKSNTVFGRNAEQIEAWSKTTSRALGVSQQAALEAAGTYGNLFRAFGINEQESAKMSTALVTLAADLASFNNVPIEDALLALRSGLSGETEPLKRFGIAINDARLKEEALRLGLIKTTKGTLPQAIKTQAAYALILKDSALAQGDVARTSDGLANQLKFLQAGLQDAKAGFGEALLPAALSVVSAFNEKLVPAIERVVTSIQLQGAEGGLKTLGVEISNVISNLNGTAKAVKDLILVFIGIKVVVPLVTALRASWITLTATIGATATATQIAAGVMKSALVSTGIGALIVVAGVLVAKIIEMRIEANATDKTITFLESNGVRAFNRMGQAADRTIISINAVALAASRASDELENAGIKRVKQGRVPPIAVSVPATNEGLGATAANAGKATKAIKGLSEAAKIAQNRMATFTDELSSANSILDQAKEAFNSFKSSVSSAITGIIDFGSAHSSSAQSIQDAQKAQDDLTAAQKAYDDSLKTKNIQAQQTALENLQAAQTAATNSITQKKSFIQVLQDQAALAAQFAGKVQTLISLGLSESAIGQVLAAGADAGSAIADEIIAGGATVVDQVNTLVSATASVAEQLGTSAATQFYQAGITAGQALVEGVRAAIAAAGFVINAQGTIINQAAINQVNAAIAAAKTKKSKGGKKITAAERQSIMDLAASLGVEVPAFAKGGIVTGPTLALIGEAGPEAVVPLSGRNSPMGNTYNINVNAGMGTNGAQVGKEIVDAIKRFEKSSGPVFASA